MPSSSCLLALHPYVHGLGWRASCGGRERNSKLLYSQMHPVIPHGRHPLTKLIICSEHLRLLHGGPTLVSSALTCHFHIVSMRKVVRSIIRQCITCHRRTTRPRPQMLGQLPLERVTPGAVFEKFGIDYAGPIYIKHGMVRRPVTVKVCLSPWLLS